MADIFVSDIKAVGQNNQQKQHNIPLGSLVEVFDPDEETWNNPEDFMHGLRLWVTGHTHDCYGTPLYVLSFKKNAYVKFKDFQRKAEDGDKLANRMTQYYRGQFYNGYFEESLIVIKAHQAK